MHSWLSTTDGCVVAFTPDQAVDGTCVVAPEPHGCTEQACQISNHGDLVASLTSVNGESALEFESYNGSIELSLPADIEVNTQLRTDRGRLLTDFDVTEIGDPVRTQVQTDGTKNVQFDKFVRGTINGGGPVLRIETQHGDIRIRKHAAGLGDRLGREWNERLGQGLGDQWNEKIGEKLGREIDERLNRKPTRD